MPSPFRVPSVINHNTITLNPSALPAGQGAPELLRQVVDSGSSHGVVSALGLDEAQAWNYLVAANNLADEPLFRAQAEDLWTTSYARRILGREEAIAHGFLRFLESPERGVFQGFHKRHQFLRRLAARTSARNQFVCRVHGIRLERVNAVVNLELGGGDMLSAHITRRSVQDLGLVWGRDCYALVDPAWVEVLPGARDGGMESNRLRGRVVRMRTDPVDTEVAIELEGGRIVVATMTLAELNVKGIGPGAEVRVVIQSSQIILAVDEDPLSSPEE